MAKHVTKTVYVEAEQWDGTEEEAERLHLRIVSGRVSGRGREIDWALETDLGNFRIRKNDWIVTIPNKASVREGWFTAVGSWTQMVVRDDLFRHLYEAVEEDINPSP